MEAVAQFNCGRCIVNIPAMEFGNKSTLQLVVLGVLVVLVNGKISDLMVNLLLIVNTIPDREISRGITLNDNKILYSGTSMYNITIPTISNNVICILGLG